jgi:3-oxoacyl-[acyl-carrier protein] reductase
MFKTSLGIAFVSFLMYVSKPDQANETVKVAQALGVRATAIQADSADGRAVVAAVERTEVSFGGDSA